MRLILICSLVLTIFAGPASAQKTRETLRSRIKEMAKSEFVYIPENQIQISIGPIHRFENSGRQLRTASGRLQLGKFVTPFKAWFSPDFHVELSQFIYDGSDERSRDAARWIPLNDPETKRLGVRTPPDQPKILLDIPRKDLDLWPWAPIEILIVADTSDEASERILKGIKRTENPSNVPAATHIQKPRGGPLVSKSEFDPFQSQRYYYFVGMNAVAALRNRCVWYKPKNLRSVVLLDESNTPIENARDATFQTEVRLPNGPGGRSQARISFRAIPSALASKFIDIDPSQVLKLATCQEFVWNHADFAKFGAEYNAHVDYKGEVVIFGNESWGFDG